MPMTAISSISEDLQVCSGCEESSIQMELLQVKSKDDQRNDYINENKGKKLWHLKIYSFINEQSILMNNLIMFILFDFYLRDI